MIKKISSVILSLLIFLCGLCTAMAEEVTDIKVSYDAEEARVTVSGTAYGRAVITISAKSISPAQMTADNLPAAMDMIYTEGSFSHSLVLPDSAPLDEYCVYVSAESGETSASFIRMDVSKANSVILELKEKQSAKNAAEFESTINANEFELGIIGDDEIYKVHGAQIINLLYISDFDNISEFSALYNKYAALCVLSATDEKDVSAVLSKYSVDLSVDYERDVASDARLTESILSDLYSLLINYDYEGELKAEGEIDFSKILNECKALAAVRVASGSSWMEIKEVILNLFADTFSDIADETRYGSVSDKNAVFKQMMQKSYSDFDDIGEAFKTASGSVYASEQSKNQGGGSSSGGGASSSGGSYTAPLSSAPDTLDSVSSSAFFSDVSEEHWGFGAVAAIAGAGIISGYPDGEFKGDKNITRAEFTKIVMSFVKTDELEAGDEVSFSDVNDGDWFKEVVCEASKYEIILGSGGMFLPNDQITREDAALIIYRILEKNGKASLAKKYFDDSDDISDYAQEAVESLGSMKIISGRGNNKFAPKAQITRYEAAQLIYNAFMKGEI